MHFFKNALASILVAVFTLTLFATTTVFAASSPAQEYALTSNNATLHGKYFTKNGGYAFSYGSAGFSVNFTGSEFWIYVPETPEWDGVIKVNIAVLVDTDMPLDAEMVTIDRTGWFCVASGLSSGQHKITIRKQSRGFYGFMAADWFNVTKFGLSVGGQVKAPDKLSDLVVEVYGDSISNGDAVWLNPDGSNSAYTYGDYTGVIERLLDAEVKVCANSGNGLLGWVLAGGANGKLDNLLPPQNCWNVIDSQAASQSYSHKGANAADVVIINLGTNDRVEYNNGDMTDEMFNAEYLRFIKQIKTDCPNAIVICALGAMGGMPEFGDNLPKIAADANAWNGSEFCYYLELQQCGTIRGGYGYDNGHPSNLAHEVYGLQMATIINKALGLNKTLPTDIPEEAYIAKLGNSVPSGNIMNAITHRTDNLSRAEALVTTGLIITPDDDDEKDPVNSDTSSDTSSKPTEDTSSKPSTSSKPTEGTSSKPSTSSKPTEDTSSKPSASSKPSEQTSKPSVSSKPSSQPSSKPSDESSSVISSDAQSEVVSDESGISSEGTVTSDISSDPVSENASSEEISSVAPDAPTSSAPSEESALQAGTSSADDSGDKGGDPLVVVLVIVAAAVVVGGIGAGAFFLTKKKA